jgi:hypothetical protein
MKQQMLPAKYPGLNGMLKTRFDGNAFFSCLEQAGQVVPKYQEKRLVGPFPAFPRYEA